MPGDDTTRQHDEPREIFGRERELSVLTRLLNRDGPRVAHIYGDPGIGKSTLAKHFAAIADGNAFECILLDGREIEPTSQACLKALASVVHAETDLASIEEALRKREHAVLIILDSYEVLRLLDTWLRQQLTPALPANTRLVLVGRHQPAVGWHIDGREKQTLNLALEPLTTHQAQALLQQLGVTGEQQRFLADMLHGHPLAIQLAAATLRSRPRLELPDGSLQQVLDELIRVYMADIHDSKIRQLLEGAAVVRRINVPLLHALFPQYDPEWAYSQLQQIDFTEIRSDGLNLHDAIKTALEQSLRARNPQHHRQLRQRAWKCLVQHAATAARPELWRYTADILYLIENPVVREAFFPSNASELAVEQARAEHLPAIRELIEKQEGRDSAQAILNWWQHLPQSFIVARDGEGRCRGVCCRFNPAEAKQAALEADPITQYWNAHLDNDPMPGQSRALFIRRWLDSDLGEHPSGSQAALWLDLKRTYMEMRPALRRVYLTLNDLQPYASVAETLGFRALNDTIAMDNKAYSSAVLDFGEASVNGWLSNLAAVELGIDKRPGFLDREARELVEDDNRIALTPLEFSVLTYLVDRPGEAVSREELLRNVWNTDYNGWSNKVDAVVACLRRKLKQHAQCIETVSGVGYRFRD